MDILLVDDDSSIRDKTKTFLEEEIESANVEAASSAEKALTILEESCCDVVVSDYKMSGMDGLEFLEVVRKDKSMDIPFILFTGKGREYVAMEALNLGADRYLQKRGEAESQFGVLAQAVVQEVEHSKISEEKQRVEAEHSSLVEGSEDPIYIVDENFRFTFANQAELERHDLEEEELIGSKFHELHPTEDSRDFEEKVERVLETCEPQTQGIKHERTGRYFERTISPIKTSENGEVERVSVISKDVTELKEHERKLEESEERYRRLFESARDGMLILDASSGEIEDANPYIQEITGYSKGELLGKNLWEIGFFQDILDNKERFEELVEEGYIRYDDLPLKTKDGEEVPVEFVSNAYQAGGKQVVQCNIRNISERKKAEEKIRNSERKFKKIFEGSPDPVVLINKEGVFTEVNQTALQKLGFKEEEVIGTSLEGNPALPEETRKKIVERFERRKEGEEISPYVVELNTKDGSRITVEINVVVLEEEEFEGEIVIARDITERKEVEEKYQKVTEESPHGIYIFQDGGLQYVNKSLVEILGYSREELLTMDPIKLVPSEYRDKVKEWTLQALTGDTSGLPKETEVKMLRKDGEKIWVQITPSLIEHQGKPAIIGNLSDITKRKEAEGMLRESEERYRRLFESARDGMLILDAESGKIKDANPYIQDLSGYSKEELVGKKLWEIGTFEDIVENDRRFEELVDGGFIRYEDLPIETKKGNEKTVEFVSNTYEAGGVEVVQCNIRDVTERKKAEKHKEFLHSLLRHDVRNKIQLIQGYNELLKDFDLPEEVEEYISKGEREAGEAAEIIETVRELREAQEEEIRVVDVDKDIEKAVAQERPVAEDEGVKIKAMSSEKECEVMAGGLLDRVFSNIIENSIKHSGGSEVQVYGEEKEEEFICIIEDDGRGIPDEEKDKIFEKGHTAGETGGTGFGMFLVKSLVNIYGGNIEVKDSDLGGARFDIHLQMA